MNVKTWCAGQVKTGEPGWLWMP